MPSSSPATPGTIALYPGAFRPPHANHYASLRLLAERADVDQVVIVVSNRYRVLPGTPWALDAELSVKIWQLYLRGQSNVRVEVATGSAVSHALGYLTRAQPGQRLLFAVGQEDLESGDVRFQRLPQEAAKYGVVAEQVALPFPGIRATTLRQALVDGGAAQGVFESMLPDHLAADERQRVWRWCRDGRRDLTQLIRPRIATILAEAGVEISALEMVRDKAVDPVFRGLREGRSALLIKYAKDTVREAALECPGTAKPRQRLSVERRALRRLRGQLNATVALPEVLHYDKQHKILLLSELFPHGRTLADQLRDGVFDPAAAAPIGDFLARCHWGMTSLSGLWGSLEADQRHWRLILTRAAKRADEALAAEILPALLQSAQGECRRGLFHLDLHAGQLRQDNRRWGIVDWELSGVWGDPAYDLGTLVGHYLFWGEGHAAQAEAGAAIDGLCDAYSAVLGARCEAMMARVQRYAGLSLLILLAERGSTLNERCRQTLRQLAVRQLHRADIGTQPAEAVCRSLPGCEVCRA